MIAAAFARVAARFRRAEPYAPRPEPLATPAELAERIARRRAEVQDLIAAVDMNRRT